MGAGKIMCVEILRRKSENRMEEEHEKSYYESYSYWPCYYGEIDRYMNNESNIFDNNEGMCEKGDQKQ